MPEMPSFLAEAHLPPTLNGSGPTSKRSSLDPTKAQSLSVQRVDEGRPNGVLTNGAVSGMHSHLNGHRTEEESAARRSAAENGTPVEPPSSSKRSSRVLQEKERPEEDRPALERLATRDDGYFASQSAETNEGFFSTKVKLTTLNGDSGHETPETLVESSTALPGTGTTEGSLRVPSQNHRISSPPSFQGPGQISLTQTPRSQQRHTLEVPRVSTSRLSRETTNSYNPSDDVISASGRFSPNTPTRRRGSITLVRRVTRSLHSDMHLDEMPLDHDAAIHAEVIRQKRSSRRKKREEEEEDRVLVGTKVDQNHVNYVMAYNMLTGIRFTVSRTNAKVDRELTEADFSARHKFSFDVTGAELTPSAKYDFKFKDYAPWVFRHLRAIFKLDPADYLMSLTSKYILSELGSPGKSGSFFYFSRDYKYIIKTIHHAEHKVLRKMLKEYYEHVRENPNTLLSQFYGLHRVKIPFGRKVHFVVMNNLFPPHRDIHKTYDLKGSTVGRMFEEKNLETNPRATLKDLNWLSKNNHLELGPSKRHNFVEQMEKDVKLLQKLKIMDYSLLVGIHDLTKGNEEQLRDKTLKVFQLGTDKEEELQQPPLLTRTPSKLEASRKAKEMRQTLRHEKPIPMSETGSKMPDEMEDEKMRKDHYFYLDDGGFRASHENNNPGDVIYYLGIIDCLTHYGFVKRIEHFYKALSNVESQISPIPPDRYGDRFVRFISGITKSQEEAEKDAVEKTQEHTGAEQERIKSPVDKVMEKAERQAERSSQDLAASDSKAPNRELSTTRSPSAERGDPGGFTLPVVEEAVESGSTGGRSHDGSPARHDRGRMEGQKPPPTPPKDDAHSIKSRRSASPPVLKDSKAASGEGPPTPPSEKRSPGKRLTRLDVDKELPPPPPPLAV